MSEVVQQVIEQPRGVYQSRWGYHACSFETFFKLKQLAKLVRRADAICHQFKRWFRKSVRNRVARRKIRNDKGWVVGYGDAVPIPEPVGPDLLTGKLAFKRHIDINGVFHEEEVAVEFMNLTDLATEIIKCRNAAGSPCAGPEGVQRLSLAVESVNELYAQFYQDEVNRKLMRPWEPKK